MVNHQKFIILCSFFHFTYSRNVFFAMCIYVGGVGGLESEGESEREYKTIARKSSIKNNVIAYFTLILACTPETWIEVWWVFLIVRWRLEGKMCESATRGRKKFHELKYDNGVSRYCWCVSETWNLSWMKIYWSDNIGMGTTKNPYTYREGEDILKETKDGNN